MTLENILVDNAILMLVILALAAAWFLGYRFAGRSKTKGKVAAIPRDYFVGLNYLLNDEPDEAIDSFIQSLEVSANTLETHMALGTLLRRRGKVDRSIGIYQTLLARPGLDENTINQIKLDLVKSYIAAGLLDRAERLLKEMRHARLPVRREALRLAIQVYQQEKDWAEAVEVARELLKSCAPKDKDKIQILVSQFYCELGEAALDGKHYKQAGESLKKAFQANKNSVRSSLLLARMERESGRIKHAIKYYKQAMDQDALFSNEVFPLLLACYRELGSERQLDRFLTQSLEHAASPEVVAEVARFYARQSGNSEALDFLMSHLRKRPSLQLMDHVLSLKLEQQPELEDEDFFRVFKAALDDHLNQGASYRCENCGFEARFMHWQCPGCKQWEVIKPLKEFSAE